MGKIWSPCAKFGFSLTIPLDFHKFSFSGLGTISIFCFLKFLAHMEESYREAEIYLISSTILILHKNIWKVGC